MRTESPQHIMVGMSGGVDSSVTALLLKNAGHHVSGVFMKNWEAEDTDTFCNASLDMADAQAVCDQLKIELHRVNFAEEYWEHVFSHFLSEYKQGRTPNPDILCNKEIKFKALLHYARQQGADYIATGHYARILHDQDHSFLLKGKDLAKDQSYFLYALNQTQLQQSLFPLGDLTKTHIRALAKAAQFKNHDKKDSTGICFIGERKFKTFLNDFLPAKPGSIETLDGIQVGEHDGLMFYTLGQRQGLKIGGMKKSANSPWYVVEKNMDRNVLIVAQGQHHTALFKKTLYLDDIHWINACPTLPLTVSAKTRYRQEDQLCTIQPFNAEFRVDFAIPQRALTEGQSIVFYQHDHCLGGGIIKRCEKGSDSCQTL